MTTIIGNINALYNNEGVRKLLLLLRIPIGAAAAAGIIYFAREEWFWPAFAVSLAGAMAHWWCFACIKTQKELAQNGPYVLVRNPMYIARYFLMAGMILFTGQWMLLAPFTAFYIFYAHNRVKREERKLRKIFGAPYEEFCERVPRFLPSLANFDLRKMLYLRADCFARNRGYWNMLAIFCFYAAAYYWVFVNG